MSFLVPVILIGWIPATLLFFVRMTPRRAVVAATIVAWLFLPVAGIRLAGIPDLTKSSAPMYGLALGVLLLDRGRLAALRPSWLDLPVIVWCAVPLPTSLLNDLGPYDGFSGVLNQATTWGLPYLLGRLYLADLAGLRELAIGIVCGGLAYVPLCLFEIRMSPQLHRIVYGFFASSLAHATRYGGYRPMVFMATGLELGMWMAAASFLGGYLWLSGALKRIAGVPVGVLLPILVGTTILCKSVGAVMLLGLGLVVLGLTRLSRTRLPVWALLAAPVAYEATRATGVWDGRSGVTMVQTWVDAERASSLEYRMNNEDILIAKAVQRPLLGWGGWSRSRVFDEQGNDISVTDGMWIITLGHYGALGVGALTSVLLAPTAVLAKRPARMWSDRSFAPASALAVMSALYMLDNLSNAMFNPIYVLAAGGLAGLAASRSCDPGHDRSVHFDDSETLPKVVEAALERDTDGDPAGDLSPVDLAALVEREQAWRLTVESLEEAGDGADLRSLRAFARQRLGRILARQGRTAEALAECEIALELRTGLAAEQPAEAVVARDLAEARNDLAWLLALAPEPSPVSASRAARLAAEAARAFPYDPVYWNTLGAAHCRLGDWPAAIHALGRSAALGGSSVYNDLLLALVHALSGDVPRARMALHAADLHIGADNRQRRDVLSLRIETGLLMERISSS